MILHCKMPHYTMNDTINVFPTRHWMTFTKQTVTCLQQNSFTGEYFYLVT